MLKFKRSEQLGDTTISCCKKTVNSAFDTHFHDFYEIEYIISGHGTYTIDGEKYDIKSGMLFFMSPLNFHSVTDNDCQLFNVMFTLGAVNEELLAKLLKYNAICVNEENDIFLSDLFKELCASTDSEYSSLLLNTLIYKLSTLVSPVSTSPLNRATIYILDNFRNNVTLKEVAGISGFSVQYFSYIFKKEIGTSFKNYVDAVRFEYARKLIIHTKYSISEVCKLSGFDDYANFLRRFKIRFGMTATQLRSHNETDYTQISNGSV